MRSYTITYIVVSDIVYLILYTIYKLISYIYYIYSMWYHILYIVHLWIVSHYTVAGRSKGAGDQAQIATRQCISQGKRHEPSCCPFQGGTSPVSIRIVWRAYTLHTILIVWRTRATCQCPARRRRHPTDSNTSQNTWFSKTHFSGPVRSDVNRGSLG